MEVSVVRLYQEDGTGIFAIIQAPAIIVVMFLGVSVPSEKPPELMLKMGTKKS